MQRLFSVAAMAVIYIAFACVTPALAQDKANVPAKVPDLSAQQLKDLYQEIQQHVTKNTKTKLPADWNERCQRFAAQIVDTATFSAAVRTMVAACPDPQVHVLSSVKEIEDHTCRLASGYVGIGLRFTPLQLVNEGLKITRVEPDSTASDAGLAVGAVISAVDGVSLKDMRWSSAEALFAGADGSTMKLTVVNDGKTSEASIKRNTGKDFGLTVELANPTCLFEIDHVSWDSPAKKAGLEEHDIVMRINKIDVAGTDAGWLMDQATSGHLGTVISLTLKRDGKSFDVDLTRDIVPAWNQSYGGLYTQNFDGPRGRGLTRLPLKVLDWRKIIDKVDRDIDEINNHSGCILDLRGCTGNDPELAARIAARFISDGALFSYTDSAGGKEKTLFLVANFNADKLLWRFQGAELTPVETLHKQALETKLVVLVDGETSGTAEAIARALQENGRATVVGSKTAGVSNLVATRVFTAGSAEFYIQTPAMTLVDAVGQPISAVSPDRGVYWGDPVETAKDEVAGRFWYNDLGVLCIGSMLLVLLLVAGLARWASRRRPSDASGAGDAERQRQEPEKPLTLVQRWLVAGALVACLASLATLVAVQKSAHWKPEGAKPELVVELITSLPKHEKQVQQFRQLEQEVTGPITFKVIEDPKAKDYIYPGIKVTYRWLDKNGTQLSEGGLGQGAENKLEMVRAIEMAQSNLGLQYGQTEFKIITWHRQTPVLRGLSDDRH